MSTNNSNKVKGRGRGGGGGDGGRGSGSGQGSTRADHWTHLGQGGQGPPGRDDLVGTYNQWMEEHSGGGVQPQPDDMDDGGQPRTFEYPPWPVEGYTCIGPHEQWWNPRKDIKYKMFSAASDGCLWCVKWWVEHKGIPVNSESDNMKYNVLDYAVEGRRTQNVSSFQLEEWLMLQHGLQLSQPVSQPGHKTRPGPYYRR